ncbi:MAG: CTP synthase [Candidatus Caenarcaniphilales bacterium]|nr:CTP synthase [Candidatus Caenarcaniphilales bacterium]
MTNKNQANINHKGPKYVFITGGVVSSLGKGILASSLGLLLKAKGFKVTIQKLDPYLNVDPGTMSPYQHGEVYVTEDGAETDLDLGHYERFTDSNLLKINNVTAGQIYSSVINKERKGEYLGGTVQMVPHVSNQIKAKIFEAAYATESEIVIVEVGGTVGDIESLIFLESIRQIRKDVGPNNVAYIHVTLIPNLKATNELKTKPTQHSVEELRGKGINPDIVVCRTERALSKSIREKISMFVDVDLDSVIECRDVRSIYEVPLHLEEQKLTERVLNRLHLEDKPSDLSEWQKVVERIKNPSRKVKVGIVGKYTKLSDAYISVIEALRHAAAVENAEVDLHWILSDDLEPQSKKASYEDLLGGLDGILVPGGFGDRGVEGKIAAIQYARENKIPFLGLCLGMQCAVIEFARNVAGLSNANSTEFANDTPYPVIDFLPGQTDSTDKGGTMRLGSYPCQLDEKSLSYEAYRSAVINERHRHRYEFNNLYESKLQEAGLVISGRSPDHKLVEIVELPRGEHPFFVGTQFHPEYKSRPQSVHPLFLGFIRASANKLALV